MVFATSIHFLGFFPQYLRFPTIQDVLDIVKLTMCGVIRPDLSST